HQQHYAFALACRQAEYAYVLRCNALFRIYYYHAHIHLVHSAYGAYYRIELQVFMYILFLAEAGSIYQYEFFAKLVVMCMYGIAGSAGYIAYYGTFLPGKCIQQG